MREKIHKYKQPRKGGRNGRNFSAGTYCFPISDDMVFARNLSFYILPYIHEKKVECERKLSLE